MARAMVFEWSLVMLLRLALGILLLNAEIFTFLLNVPFFEYNNNNKSDAHRRETELKFEPIYRWS